MNKTKDQKPKRQKTDDIFYGVTGIRWMDQIPENRWRLNNEGDAYYIGDGVMVCPDGKFITDSTR